MTSQRSIAIFSVIIVCFMVSSAFIPAVNALSDDNDRDAMIANNDGESDVSIPGEFNTDDIASLFNGDGIRAILSQLGLDGVID